MMSQKFHSLVFLLLWIHILTGQDPKSSTICTEQTTCGGCMSAGPNCGWCIQENYNHPERCDLMDNLLSKNCDSSYIESPSNDIAFDRNIPPKNAERSTEAVQLSPQELTVKLRPNGAYTFKVNFRLAEDYPVDLYYVMDLSQSMKDDKDNLAKLGDLIAGKMNTITKNFRLGFGSFVDKKAMPFVSIDPIKINTPCDGCTAPYGFRNQLPLTENTTLFKTRVEQAPISGNLDSPEGGFDAIMQAVVCKDQIGWRDQSRKMLLFSTDAGFHHAGDGKLAGIVVPNDGSCHLDTSGEYTKSLEQDYPSISQLAVKIAEKKANVIFAVTKDLVHIYKNLSVFIEGSTVGNLAGDSSNIVDLIKDNYEKISRSIELKTEHDEDLSITFKSKCLGNKMMEVSKCENISIGSNVEFDVTLLVTSCPKDSDRWRQSFNIYPVGLSEKLTVNVELICECGCEAAGKQVKNSSVCGGKGTLQCGACVCNEGIYGTRCECDGTTATSLDFEAACKQTNLSKACSGRGNCNCGKCECHPVNPSEPSKRYTGTYCECNNYNCDYEDGKLCGGPERGVCECGRCKCHDNYEGPSCACSKSTKECIAEDGSICSNKGHCECGRCVCTIARYKGKTCEDCPTCPSACDERRGCVLCMAFKKYNKNSEEICKKECDHVTVIDDLDMINDTTGAWTACKFRDDSDDCDIHFKLNADDNKVVVQKTKVCPTPVDVLTIVLSVIAGIILIGLLLLLIWKLLVTVHDRREYARFQKERENAKWDMGENPIYKQATSTFKNPMYIKTN